MLEGSVRKASGRVRITGQLIDAMSGSQLWADRFDGTFSIQFSHSQRRVIIDRLRHAAAHLEHLDDEGQVS